LLLLGGVLSIAVVAAGIAFMVVRAQGDGEPRQPRAAIIDQLSLSAPGPAFVEAATTRLKLAGYRVDYYPGDAVTVDFYRALPSYGYDLVILRVHSGRDAATDGEGSITRELDSVSLSTGEAWSAAKYPEDQRDRLLGRFTYRDAVLSEEPLFGVPAWFFEHAAKGEFDDTLVIMMGCDGLATEGLARAFLDRGASAFVGWTDDVTVSHTDDATEWLLGELFVNRHDIDEAVRRTAAAVGPDATFGGELRVLAR
jgi:hypothetical protein